MGKRKRSITASEVMEWAEKHPLVKRWLAKVQIPERRGYFFAMFCEWADMSPEELYNLKEDPKNREAEELLDKLVADEEAPFTDSVKWQLIQATKSFFSHHYRDLAKKAGKLHVPKKREERKPTKEELRQLWKACKNPRDRALVIGVNSTALAKGTLAKLTWGDIEEGWEEIELPCINIAAKKLKGGGVGKYENVRQITFLTPEAKESLIEYKEWIEQRMGRKLTENDHVWLDIRSPYKPLTYSGFGMLVWRLANEADVEFSWHDARRYVETALEEQKINPNWLRKIRGRKVRGEEAPYSKPAIEQLRAAFKDAVPSIQFLTTEAVDSTDLRMQAKLDALAAIARSKGVSETTINEIMTMCDAKEITRKEAVIRLEQLTIENPANTRLNGGNCQRIVSEEELGEYLGKGWKVQAVLSSGRIVVAP